MHDRRNHREGPLWRRLRGGPRLSDPERARARLAAFAPTLDPQARVLLTDRRVDRIVCAIADHSAYLWHLIEGEPARLVRLLEEDPARSLAGIVATLRSCRGQGEAQVMCAMRVAKKDMALLVALADLGSVWTLDEILRALSQAADALIAAALVFLLDKARDAGWLRVADPSRPQDGCGFVVLGLGKLGGLELNYSSDVDLVCVFDPDSPAIVDPETCRARFVRLVQDLVRLLQQPTSDGYVLRVDLRLRPDPGATAVAISLPSAYAYYEIYGQNWERAAMIKARPVAGDLVLGQTFVLGLAPFIWRKYFDYAAIADIHAMKRQIHAVKGHAAIAVAGHDVKLGRGGIREIEFFVQTQQLIFGGKSVALRGSRTLQMLRQLRRDGWIGLDAVKDLTRAYRFLRKVEHRLQMLDDAQTHRLPSQAEALERFSRFCGFASTVQFSQVLTRHLRAVVRHYGLLFESAPSLDDPFGSLVFTGTDDDPETLQTLASLGYRTPKIVSRLVRGWHDGSRPATRSTRARELLTELVPDLLATFSRSFDPDGAVAAFDGALHRMAAASELFAILKANAALRGLFADILGSAPSLAAAVALRPHLLDGAIDPSRDVSCDADEMTDRATAIVALAPTTEEVLDVLRDFFHEEHFLIGVALLTGDLDLAKAGAAYSALATAIVRACLTHLCGAFAREHGYVAGGAIVVVAMGKLGSAEMTATSDLDLVLIYTFDEARPVSDGPRPLHATQYFARLTQRLVSYLTVSSRRGGLYDVDMRLRPSGRQGPIATKLSAFLPYQSEEAATWEHMALTRARVIAGDDGLARRVGEAIASVLSGPPPERLREDVSHMRALIEKEKPARDGWDLKHLPGGLTDIEFLAQYLVLRHAAKAPALLRQGTKDIIETAARLDLLRSDWGCQLLTSHELFTRVGQIMRLALAANQTPDRAGVAVQRSLSAAAGVPDLPQLVDDLARARQAVREIFGAVLAPD